MDDSGYEDGLNEELYISNVEALRESRENKGQATQRAMHEYSPVRVCAGGSFFIKYFLFSPVNIRIIAPSLKSLCNHLCNHCST